MWFCAAPLLGEANAEEFAMEVSSGTVEDVGVAQRQLAAGAFADLSYIGAAAMLSSSICFLVC